MKHITYTYKDTIALIIILATFIAGFYFYAHFPDQVAIHFNMQGEVNGYGSKLLASFLLPCLMLFFYILFTLLPYVDPRKENYAAFEHVYSGFKIALITFLAIIYVLVGLRGLDIPVDLQFIIPVLLGIFFFLIGKYMNDIKPNWFIGIRTPWTISNDKVWAETHEFGGKIFMIAGILFVISGFLPNGISIGFILGIIALVIVVPVVYSYFSYKKLTNNK